MFALALASCGGGGGSSSITTPSGPPTGGGSTGTGGGTSGSNGPLAVTMTSLTMTNAPGQSPFVQVTLTVPAGFMTAVFGKLSGLPAGVSAEPKQPMALLPGTQAIYLRAINGQLPAPGTYTLTMTATTGT